MKITPIIRNSILGTALAIGTFCPSACSNDCANKNNDNRTEYVYKYLPTADSYTKDLKYTADNNVDTLMFTKDSLKHYFPNCKFIEKDSVDENGDMYHKITIYDSKNKIQREISSITNSPYAMNHRDFEYKVITPEIEKTYFIGDNKLYSVQTVDRNTGLTSLAKYGGTKNVQVYEENLNDSIKLVTSYKYNDGGIISEEYSNTRNPQDYHPMRIKYINNYKYLEEDMADYQKFDNLLVNDLVDDISKNSLFNMFKTRNALQTDILKRITEENVFEVLALYNKQTDSDLIKDIICLNNPLISANKKYFIEHITSSAIKAKNFSDNSCGKYLAEMINKSYYGYKGYDIENYINLITPYNVKYVVKNFAASHYGQKSILASVNSMENLDDMAKKKFINHIINMAVKGCKTGKSSYSKDILQDIINHKNDIQKLDVDLRRFANRHQIEFRDDLHYAIPNGKIDKPFRQGNVGDCWLVAVVNSINSKPNGKKFLESLINYNQSSDKITVKLPGAGKSYTFDSDELNKSTQLAEGDGDVRVIEMAVDKYLKEQAYQDIINNVDIDGNWTHRAIEFIVGNSNHKDYVYPFASLPYLTQDFNDKNTIYTISIHKIPGDTFITALKPFGKKQENAVIHDSHAYAIVKSDDNYLYLLDPNDITNNVSGDKEKLIRVSRIALKGISASIESATLPRVK